MALALAVLAMVMLRSHAVPRAQTESQEPPEPVPHIAPTLFEGAD
jgi:hypothetical protein